jgi:hypothetical protein
MNRETLALIQRPYQEIIDDILTSIVGGVVNEPNIFDIRTDFYPLAKPSTGVRGITGTTEAGEHREFLREVDFRFDQIENAVIWLEGGVKPADRSIFYVDYFVQNATSPLTDINVGSVTRTLSEGIGREIATVYEQINEAYFAGFIDTARGTALDLVVSILGVVRQTKDFAVGTATFFRDPAVDGNIAILEGTLLSTTKGDVLFQTTQIRTLQRGQVRIDVPIRATDAFKGEAGKVPAGEITKLAQGVAGIARVNNFDATFLGTEDESDEELRARAKAVLRSLGKATLAALIRVIFEQRASLLEVWDPNGPLTKRTNTPGTAVLLIETEPERFPSVRGAIEETRAAGVVTSVIARYIFFKPRVSVSIGAGITPDGKLKIIEELIEALQSYVDGLGSADPADGQAMLGAMKEVEGVKDVVIVDVMAWRSDIGLPSEDTLIDAVMTAIEGTPPGDETALRSAIAKAVTEIPPLLPTGNRIPDRSLVQGESGERATDAEIEEGKFKVVATIDGDNWWVVLDISAADIALLDVGS